MLQVLLYIIIILLTVYVMWSYGMDNDNWFGRWVNSWLNTSQSKKYSLRQIDEAWGKLDETKANLEEYKKKLSELDKTAPDYEEQYQKYSAQIQAFTELERRYIAILDDASLYQIRRKLDAEEELPVIEQQITTVEKEIAEYESNEKNSLSDSGNLKEKLDQLHAKLNELRVKRCRTEAIINEPDDDDYMD